MRRRSSSLRLRPVAMWNFFEGGEPMIIERTGQTEASLLAAVAEELRAVRNQIEQLAGLLVSDARIVTDYMDQFQAFDLLAQSTDESANVIDRLAQGLPAEEAIAKVRLTAIQQRLSAAIARE